MEDGLTTFVMTLDLVEKENFYTASLNESVFYDIIHLHSVDALVYKLRRRYGNKKKIILHYHGTDLRGSYKKSISLALRLKRVGVRMKISYGYLEMAIQDLCRIRCNA